MSAFSQKRSIRDEFKPIEPEAKPTAARGDLERSSERSLLIIDSRPLDGQCLAGCISARKTEMDVVCYVSMNEWRRKQVPRQFAAVMINIGGKEITDPAVTAEIKAITSTTDVPTIVMSDSESLVHILKALELGAKGYIPTSVSLDVCIEAIALAIAGGVFVPAGSVFGMRQALYSETIAARPFNEILTVRQAQVAEALCRGKANKIIAYELNMQESTVKVHIRSIMKKVKATNRTEVAYKLNDMFPHERSSEVAAEQLQWNAPA